MIDYKSELIARCNQLVSELAELKEAGITEGYRVNFLSDQIALIRESFLKYDLLILEAQKILLSAWADVNFSILKTKIEDKNNG